MHIFWHLGCQDPEQKTASSAYWTYREVRLWFAPSPKDSTTQGRILDSSSDCNTWINSMACLIGSDARKTRIDSLFKFCHVIPFLSKTLQFKIWQRHAPFGWINPNLWGRGRGVNPPTVPFDFPLVTIKRHFAAFSIYWRHWCKIWYRLLAAVSRYWAKIRWGYFQFLDFWSIPYKRKLS